MPINQWQQGPNPLVRALRGGALGQDPRASGYWPAGQRPPIVIPGVPGNTPTGPGPGQKPIPDFGNPLGDPKRTMPTLPPGSLPPANYGHATIPTVPSGGLPPANTGGKIDFPTAPAMPVDPTKPIPGNTVPIDPMKPMPGNPYDPRKMMPGGIAAPTPTMPFTPTQPRYFR